MATENGEAGTPKKDTDYVVLEQTKAEDGQVAWLPVAVVSAASYTEAIKNATTEDGDEDTRREGSFRGVPVSSWKGVVTNETQTRSKATVVKDESDDDMLAGARELAEPVEVQG